MTTKSVTVAGEKMKESEIQKEPENYIICSCINIEFVFVRTRKRQLRNIEANIK